MRKYYFEVPRGSFEMSLMRRIVPDALELDIEQHEIAFSDGAACVLTSDYKDYMDAADVAEFCDTYGLEYPDAIKEGKQ